MLNKIFTGSGAIIIALIGWGIEKIPANTSWIPSIIFWILAGVCLIVYWFKHEEKLHTLPVNSYQKDIDKHTQELRKRENTRLNSEAPTIGIDADNGSFVNAPGARINNQDISIKANHKSIVNTPNVEINNKRK